MKQYCELVMNAGARGVKIICSGRLAGSEIARSETQKIGSIPLHTLDADVDYAVATARTTYGAIGIKAWIYKGKFGEEAGPRLTGPARRRHPPAYRRQEAQRGGASEVKPAKATETQGQVKAAGVDPAAPPQQNQREKPESKEKGTE